MPTENQSSQESKDQVHGNPSQSAPIYTHTEEGDEHEWTLPRPPIFRLCTLTWTSSAWPDNGAGVWKIMGYEDMGSKEEKFLLQRVMPSVPGGSTGEIINIFRSTHDRGGLRVWTKKLEDDKYCLKK